jgi:hypothetical protein
MLFWNCVTGLAPARVAGPPTDQWSNAILDHPAPCEMGARRLTSTLFGANDVWQSRRNFSARTALNVPFNESALSSGEDSGSTIRRFLIEIPPCTCTWQHPIIGQERDASAFVWLGTPPLDAFHFVLASEISQQRKWIWSGRCND